MLNADATTALLAPLGSPFVSVSPGEDGVLWPHHQSQTVKLRFLDPGNAPISYNARVLNATPAP